MGSEMCIRDRNCFEPEIHPAQHCQEVVVEFVTDRDGDRVKLSDVAGTCQRPGNPEAQHRAVAQECRGADEGRPETKGTCPGKGGDHAPGQPIWNRQACRAESPDNSDALLPGTSQGVALPYALVHLFGIGTEIPDGREPLTVGGCQYQ